MDLLKILLGSIDETVKFIFSIPRLLLIAFLIALAIYAFAFGVAYFLK